MFIRNAMVLTGCEDDSEEVEDDDSAEYEV